MAETTTNNYGKKKFPLLAVAAGGAAIVAAIILWPKSGKASQDPNGGGGSLVKPPLPLPGRKTRPDPFPAGAGEARVIPNSQGGMLTRTEPTPRGGNSTLVAPNGDPRHAFNGDTVAVLEMGIKEIGQPAGSKAEWWRIVTPGGLTGFSRAVDPQGVSNFTLVRPPANAGPGPVATMNPFAGASAQGEGQVAGVAGITPPAIGGRAFGVAYDFMGQTAPARAAARSTAPRTMGRAPVPSAAAILQRRFGRFTGLPVTAITTVAAAPVLTCQAPGGCWLRAAPDGRLPGQVLIEPNTRVLVDEFVPGPKQEASSPGHGGWARVRYLGRGMQQPVTGYVLSEWLA